MLEACHILDNDYVTVLILTVPQFLTRMCSMREFLLVCKSTTTTQSWDAFSDSELEAIQKLNSFAGEVQDNRIQADVLNTFHLNSLPLEGIVVKMPPSST